MYEILSFAAAVFVLTITPGPGVLAVAGVGSGFGWALGLRFLVGLFLGTNLVALAVASGVATIALAEEGTRIALTIASAAYLTYLAARVAFAGTHIAFFGRARPLSPLDGLLIQTINPKAYALNTAFFSGFELSPSSITAEILLKFLIINALWAPVHLAWLWAGVTLRKLELSRRVRVSLNAAMALALVAAVGLAIASMPER